MLSGYAAATENSGYRVYCPVERNAIGGLMALSAKRSRLSAAEARELTLEAGLDHLHTVGLEARIDVSLEDMHRIAGVPRSSAYKAWQQLARDGETPQVSFRRELLRSVLMKSGQGTPDEQSMIHAAQAVLTRRDELSNDELAAELVRVVIAAQFLDAAERRGYRVALAIWLAATSVPQAGIDDEVLVWIAEADQMFLDQLGEVFKRMANICNKVPRADLVGPHFWEQFSTAVVALGDGLLPRLRTSERAVLFDIEVPSSRDTAAADSEEWTLFAVAVHAIWDRFFIDAEAASTPKI